MPESTPRAADLAPNGWPRDLVRGFKAGERTALTEVYRRHAEEVALLLRHGFAFEASGRRHRFVGFGSGFELQDVLHETSATPGSRSFTGLKFGIPVGPGAAATR